MLDLYPPQKRGNIMAIWGIGVMLGPILGPTLGGYLDGCLQLALGVLRQCAVWHRVGGGIWMFFKDSPQG